MMAEYIERQKVYEMLHAIGGCGAKPESWADGWDKAIDTAIKELAKIPAADVRPERHGRWVWNPNGMDWNLGAWQCSECCANSGFSCDLYINPHIFINSNYCPNCGAKMDGEVNAKTDN